MEGNREGGPAQVGALKHGLEILRLFSDEQQVVGVSQMAAAIGVHRSNASRLAATLHTMGYLTRTGEAGRYRLGPQLIRLGRLAGRNNDLVQQTLEPLRRLVEETGETGHTGMLDGREVVTVAVVDGWHTVRMHSHVNKRSPAHRSSLGKVLLADLPDVEIRARFRGVRLDPATPNVLTSVSALLDHLTEVRAQGYATDNEEVELGLRCVSAPIHDAEGTVVAALGLSGPAHRLPPESIAALSTQVKTTAAEATQAIGGPYS